MELIKHNSQSKLIKSLLIAPIGLIEYVDKEDETVKKMLSLKGDIFPDYNKDNFEKNILVNGSIVNKIDLSKTRILYEFKKN